MKESEVDPHAELAKQTQLLRTYRLYRDDAQKEMDKAADNVARETQRIIAAETRIRELVAELGLA